MEAPEAETPAVPLEFARKGEEFAVLVAVGADAAPEGGNLPVLDELAELARTAGAKVVGRLYQRLDRPHAASYVGKGKLDELGALCRELSANLVITDTDLTPAQVRNIEEAVALRVIDRSELILDIFARHARTQQARLQVELAQLQYQAPRLKRMWTHLSRITGAGGIGSRGPGEKQIEVDRRLVRERIQILKDELSTIASRREREARSRPDTFRVALVGYTNVGKSTIMKALTGADVFVADQLFATLDTKTRKWPLGDGLDVLLSDTVGFIQKLPHHLVASFHATLEEVREADLLLHVVDAGDPEVEQRLEVVRGVLEAIGAGSVPELVVLNKCDLLRDPVEATILARKLDAKVTVAAARGQGLDDLAKLVRDRAGRSLRVVELRIPAADGRSLALVASAGRVISQRYDGETCVMTASLGAAALGLLRRFVTAADDAPGHAP